MVRISAEEKQYLIEKGYLKVVKGRYAGLVVCNREHSSRAKTYFVEDSYAYYLKKRRK